MPQGFFEGIRATRGGAGGPGAPRPAVGAGALAMDTMDDDDAAAGVSDSPGIWNLLSNFRKRDKFNFHFLNRIIFGMLFSSVHEYGQPSWPS